MVSLTDLPQDVASYAAWTRGQLEELGKLFLTCQVLTQLGEEQKNFSLLTDQASIKLQEMNGQFEPIWSALSTAIAVRDFADMVFNAPDVYPDLASYVEDRKYDELVITLSDHSPDLLQRKWGFGFEAAITIDQMYNEIYSNFASSFTQQAGQLIKAAIPNGLDIDLGVFKSESLHTVVLDKQLIASVSGESTEQERSTPLQ